METTNCKWCGGITMMTATEECDLCWELRHRIEQNVGLAKRMLASLLNKHLEINHRYRNKTRDTVAHVLDLVNGIMIVYETYEGIFTTPIENFCEMFHTEPVWKGNK